MAGPRTLECAIIRGGTSKAIFLHGPDVPDDPLRRDQLLLRVFGSPDPRQIDGLGGADPLTSKCAIVSASDHPDYDLDYLFAQVAIDRAYVDYRSVCGNISSGLGYYALWRGLCTAAADTLRSRVRVLNAAEAWIEVETPVVDGVSRSHGDFRIAGVPGTGAEVVVNLAGLAGVQLGAVFPTGNRTDRLAVPGFGEVTATLMDVGNPHVFITAASLGMSGTESAADIDGDPKRLALLERVRSVAAHRLGLVPSANAATLHSPALPLLAVVAPASDYRTPTGDTVAAAEVDLLARMVFMQRAHKAYAGTSTACTGVAARLAGTVVHDIAAEPATGCRGPVRIGHPAGVARTETSVGRAAEVRRATVSRTARILLTGRANLD